MVDAESEAGPAPAFQSRDMADVCLRDLTLRLGEGAGYTICHLVWPARWAAACCACPAEACCHRPASLCLFEGERVLLWSCTAALCEQISCLFKIKREPRPSACQQSSC